MYATSTQRRHWLFENEEVLAKMRSEATLKFVTSTKNTKSYGNFLTIAEELKLCRHYELIIFNICRNFDPNMPRGVMGTSFHYFKRFYLRNSVMNFHPREISLTCVYLAAKVEEFKISIDHFIKNVKKFCPKGWKVKNISEIILNNELLLLQKLNYQLAIHNPFRPCDGFFIDIKTRCSEIKNVESLSPLVNEFVDNSFLTDACLLFSSSQIALAAILDASRKEEKSIEAYIEHTLLGSEPPEKLPKLLETIKKICEIVNAEQNSLPGPVTRIDKKLEICRNQEYNFINLRKSNRIAAKHE